VLDGVKSLVPCIHGELFVVAADLEGRGPRCSGRVRHVGIAVAAEPAMGLRAAATDG